MSKEKHEHTWRRAIKTVLLSRHRVEGGGMKYVTTTGKDVLKLWYCKCGAKQAYDLVRTKV